MEHLVLDADDTALELSEPIQIVYARSIASHTGNRIDPVEVAAAIQITWTGCRNDYLNVANQFKTSQEREFGFWQRFVQAVLEYLSVESHGKEVFEELYEHYSQPGSRKLSEGCSELLKLCESRSIPCSLVTNNDERIYSLVENLGLSPYLKHVVSAATIGWKKPNPSFFAAAETAIGASGDQILYVGNDLELDYLAATQHGWQSLWLRKQGRTPEEGTTVPQIETLMELVEALSREDDQAP